MREEVCPLWPLPNIVAAPLPAAGRQSLASQSSALAVWLSEHCWLLLITGIGPRLISRGDLRRSSSATTILLISRANGGENQRARKPMATRAECPGVTRGNLGWSRLILNHWSSLVLITRLIYQQIIAVAELSFQQPVIVTCCRLFVFTRQWIPSKERRSESAASSRRLPVFDDCWVTIWTSPRQYSLNYRHRAGNTRWICAFASFAGITPAKDTTTALSFADKVLPLSP